MLEGTPGSLASVEACSETLSIPVALRRRVHGERGREPIADYSPEKKKKRTEASQKGSSMPASYSLLPGPVPKEPN